MKERKILEFYSKESKQGPIPFLLLTVAAAAVLGVLFALGADSNASAICIVTLIYVICAAVALFWGFCSQVRYNPYSYNTIFYFGFALFILSVVPTLILTLSYMAQYPEMNNLYTVISVILYSARNYTFYLAPVILAFSVALCISNISLIRHEGKSLVNFLGIILSFLLVGGWIFLFTIDFAVSGSQTEVMIHDIVTNLLVAAYLYFECMLIGTAVAYFITARYQPKKDIDFVIILGCALRKDGTPTPLLQSRIDRALRLFREQKEKTGKELVFVTSGGQGSDEVVSESESMKNYLIEQGIPETQILMENRSVNTLENMRFSYETIKKTNPNANIAFSTNNYHVFRSGFFASCAGMRAVGIGAKTKWYFWPNAAVREFVGLLTKKIVRQAIILGLTTAFFVALTLIYYLSI